MRYPLIVLILLAGCNAPSQVEPTQSAVSTTSLRHCATVTARCTGLRELATTMPGSCTSQPDVVCFATARFGAGRETLGAMQMPTGQICGFRRVSGTSNDVAILGLIGESPDGTRQYDVANFPSDPDALAGISSSQSFVRACNSLSGI